jgi:asparagine synthase (glutamine-hydrolysing)
MCGFVGFKSSLNYRELSGDMPEAIRSLIHRGPDDSGLFYNEASGIGLGHRRLSIIDLSESGRQPMKSEDGRVSIVYSGEVYNFKDIRKTLHRHGYKFNTRTDTEVILNAYLEWGIDCLERFIGMFALAIWDSRKDLLFLARDRLGIKPLYYYYNSGTFLFASELKALMAFRTFRRDLDQGSIPLFLHYQYIPSPRTVFKNTYKLLPGHYIILHGDNLSFHSYWQLPGEPKRIMYPVVSEQEKLSELDQLLTQAVSDRLVSDVPLGALLSGGIDSSLVVSLMQKVSTSPVRTFNIGFREQKYNEAPWALRVAKHLGTNHTELYVTPKEALDVIPRLPEIYDEPFADSSAIPTYLVCSLARSQVKVALSGDGGDEQFAGYVRYWSAKAMNTGYQHLPNSVRRILSVLLGSISSRAIGEYYSRWSHLLPRRFAVANFPDKWEKFIKLMRQTTISEQYRATISVWSETEIYNLMREGLPKSRYEEIFTKTEGWPLLARLMRVDQNTYLPDAMMTKADRASMAASLELRVPLLDHRVVEFTSRLPDDMKYRNGTGKYLLKRLLGRYVPAELFERPKMGFGVPIDAWFRKDLKPLLLDYLSPDRLKREGLFDHAFVEEKIKEHLSGAYNHQYRLWALLMWEMWRDRWLEGS